jgi:hypothetical protein
MAKIDVHWCKFCGTRATLQCDGKKPDGTTCDNWVCRQHARMDAHVQKVVDGRRCCDTPDLCMDCQKLGRNCWEPIGK